MLGLILACTATSAQPNFDPYVLMKCFNTTEGCHAEEIVNVFSGGTLKPEELSQVVSDMSKTSLLVLDPNFKLPKDLVEDESVQNFIKNIKGLTYDTKIYEIIAQGDEEFLKDLNKKHIEMVADFHTFARIAGTKLISEKQILKMHKNIPEKPESFTIGCILKFVNISSTDYEKLKNIILDLFEKNIYQHLSDITGIKFETIKNLLNSVTSMIKSDSYNIDNCMKVYEQLTIFFDEVANLKFPDMPTMGGESSTFLNISELVKTIPHLQVVADSMLQILRSFEVNKDDWEKFVEVPNEDTIKIIRSQVLHLQNGFTFKELLADIVGKENVNSVLEQIKFFYSKDTTPEKILTKFLPKEIFEEYRKFMNIVVNKNSIIKDIAVYIQSFFVSELPITYESIIKAFRELGSETQVLTDLSILKDFGATDIVKQFVTDFQGNLSKYYNTNTSFVEIAEIPQENVNNLIEFLEGEPNTKELAEELNITEIIDTIIENIRYAQSNITDLIESCSFEEMKIILNETAFYIGEALKVIDDIYKDNVTIQQAIEMIPYENITDIWQMFVDSVYNLNNSYSLKEIALEVDKNASLPFSLDAAIIGLIEMKSITILGVSRLFVADDEDLQPIKDVMKEITRITNQIDNMKVSEFFYQAFGISTEDFEKIYVYVNKFLDFEYVKELNATSPAASDFFGTIEKIVSNPDKKYNINDLDKALDGLISMATNEERPPYNPAGKTDHTVGIIIACVIGGLVLVVAAAITIFVIRRRRYLKEASSSMAYTLV